VSIADGKVIFSRRNEVVTDEEKYDGLYVIRSNVAADTMSAIQVVEAYKSLINVERAFRNMKTVQLEIRPLFHRTDDRIKAHVFICMLSYYLLWHMNAALKDLYNIEEKVYTHTHVIEIMKTLQKFKMTVAGTRITAYTIAQPNDIQQKIQNLVLGHRV